MDVDAIQLAPIQHAEHMHSNKCFICHKVRCCTNKHSCPGNGNRPASCAPFSFICTIMDIPVPKPSLLLDYAWKLNITEKEALCSLGIVYGKLNQDGTPAELGSFEEVMAHMDF